jgi:hypothetical protein
LNGKQLAALYVELASMYEEEFPHESETLYFNQIRTSMVERITEESLSKKDIATIEPIFVYGHVDIHQYVTAKKRFIWF